MHRDVVKRDDRHALTVRDELNRAAVTVVHGALMQHQASPRSPRRSTDAARHAKERFLMSLFPKVLSDRPVGDHQSS